MRLKSGWFLVGLGAIALGPAVAQIGAVMPLSPPASVRPTSAPVPAPVAPAPVATAAVTAAQPYALTGFEAYKAHLAYQARLAGVRPQTVQAYVPGLRLNSRAMELDRAQMPRPRASQSNIVSPLAPYIRQHVTQSLISRGQSRYSSHWPNLLRIHARYGVDPAVLMAIYGKETSYGAITGSFDLLEALASLAYEGRRRDMFEQEFLAALKLVDSGVPRSRLKGSYAGATGYPQFMPSVVLRLRADGDGDGYADIWNNEVDALASIANYLKDAGWKPGVAWGVPVRTPANLNRQAIANRMTAPRCPRVFERHSRWLTMREWRALGVTPTRGSLPETEMAVLMEPNGPNATAYLLTGNYRAILEYNCSNFYAMSVALLADEIARR